MTDACYNEEEIVGGTAEVEIHDHSSQIAMHNIQNFDTDTTGY